MVAQAEAVLDVVSQAVAFRASMRTVDVALLVGESAALVAEEMARVEKASAALRAMAAARAVDCGAHRTAGYADPDEWVARMTGETRRRARADLATGSRLSDCPKTKEAAADGELSLGQADDITRTEREKPGSEDELVNKAKSSTRQQLGDACRNRRQEGVKRETLAARQRALRSFRTWVDRDGMQCALLKLEPIAGVALLARVQKEADRRHRAARKAGSTEPWQAHAADAVAAVLSAGLDGSGAAPAGGAGTDGPQAGGAGEAAGAAGGPGDASASADGAGASPGSGVNRAVVGAGHAPAEGVNEMDLFGGGVVPPGADAAGCARSGAKAPWVRRADVVLVVDLRTFRSGEHPDSVCHAIGGGPVPPAVVREMAKDAFLKVVFHDGVNIHTVTHVGRYRPAELDTALQLGAPPGFEGVACSVCGNRFGLQWDHVDPVSAGGITSFENEDAKCWRCHDEKTRRERAEGVYERGRSAREARLDRPPDTG